MKKLHMLAFILLFVGGLNWLLVGLFDFNLVTKILGMGRITMIVYTLIGLSAVYEFAMHGKHCKMCSGGNM